MSTLSVSTGTREHRGVLRAGLSLAALLALGDVVAGVAAVFGGFFAPPEVGAAMIVLGIGTLVLVPFSWAGGRRWPAWTAVALRLLSSATGLPAFFIPDAPASAIVVAAAGILLAVAVAVLVALGFAERRS
ncbi:hypothetical protein [Microbacterium sp.]|jgi:hypothetical protein|uniref:hypothetical protein n=1 Tax=Microbacterium sp. TaxID=51671 RepID=UPI0025E4B923|nr:hypothetical protein [Microbacterium sp.]